MTPPPLLANWMASRAKTGGRVGRGGGTGLFPPPYPHGCVGQTRSEVTPPRRRRGLSLAGRWAPSPKAAARRPHSEITDARQSQDFRAGRAVPLPAATRHVLRPPRRHWLRGPVGAARAKSPGGRAQSNSQRGTPQGPLAGPVRKNGRNRRDRPRGGGGGGCLYCPVRPVRAAPTERFNSETSLRVPRPARPRVRCANLCSSRWGGGPVGTCTGGRASRRHRHPPPPPLYQ